MPERALARIRDGAVARNCQRLRSALSGGAQLCAVVKADGYGHGAVECARAALEGGASWLAVATAAEAVALRGAGVPGRMLVMGALTGEEARAAIAADADIVAWDLEFLRACAAHSPRVHVKLDTGMGRLGTKDEAEARAIASEAAADGRAQLAGLMTHFATADEPGDDHFPAQLRRFREFVGSVESADALVHAANSAATLRDAEAHFDMVRCGVAIYGLDPFQRDPSEHELEPALSLESYVAAVKRFEAGDTAGYGRRWRAASPTWVATLPIGYGDGWRRALSNDCDVLVRGRRYPLVGTVSMDNVTVELGAETDVRVGDEAVLIGTQRGERVLCEEIAGRLGTINYEVTCALSARVRRLHEP